MIGEEASNDTARRIIMSHLGAFFLSGELFFMHFPHIWALGRNLKESLYNAEVCRKQLLR